jgi:hypothetical protein
MMEAEVSGLSVVDLEATKKALSSSSTALRLAHLHGLEEKLRSNGLQFFMAIKPFTTHGQILTFKS